jgi:thioredoxin 1
MKGSFNTIVNSGVPVLVDFFAEWCGPCKSQAPILVNVAHALEGRAKVIKIDVDKNQQVAQQYKIQGVPTLAIFKDGKIVWRKSGVMDQSTLGSVMK